MINLILEWPPQLGVSRSRLTLIRSGWRMLSDAPSPHRTAVTETVGDRAAGRVIITLSFECDFVNQPIRLPGHS